MQGAIITWQGRVDSPRALKAVISSWGDDLGGYVEFGRKWGTLRLEPCGNADTFPVQFPVLVTARVETDDEAVARQMLDDGTFCCDWRDGAERCMEGTVKQPKLWAA